MIDVTREPEKTTRDFVERENCCFCRRPTPFWFVPKMVACCTNCAPYATDADVPDRETWFRRERIANSKMPDRFEPGHRTGEKGNE